MRSTYLAYFSLSIFSLFSLSFAHSHSLYIIYITISIYIYVIYFCITNHLRSQQFKMRYIYQPIISINQEFRQKLAQCLWLRSAHEVAVKLSTVTTVITRGGSTPNFTEGAADKPQDVPGCLTDTPSSPCLSFLKCYQQQGSLLYPEDQGENDRDSNKKEDRIFLKLISKTTFCHIPFVLGK